MESTYPANIPLLVMCQLLERKQASMVYQFQSILILHAPPIDMSMWCAALAVAEAAAAATVPVLDVCMCIEVEVGVGMVIPLILVLISTMFFYVSVV